MFFLKAHIQPNQVPTRRSHKKRLLKILTSRLFIVGVLILVQLFLLLFLLVKVGTMRYWISIVFNVVSILMVLYILTREDNPSFKISWIIVIMAVPLIGGVFYLIFGRKMHGRRMARQIESYTDALLHKDHGSLPQCSGKARLVIQMNNRDHRKICVIDGNVGFTGGINLADEYINQKEKYGHWKDTAVLLRGEAVQSLTEMFLELWQFTCHESLSLSDFLPTRSHSCAGFVQPYGDSPLDNFNLAENVYMQILNHAKNYVYITTPYLILDNEMINALCLAAQSGIDVRIITPHVPDKWYVHMVTRSHYSQLLRAGIRIFEYTPGFIHAKMFVSDDSTAIVGTTNVDFRSFYLHFECGVAFYLSPMVSKVKEDFLRTQNICEENTLEKERAVKAPIRILRSLLRAFAPLM